MMSPSQTLLLALLVGLPRLMAWDDLTALSDEFDRPDTLPEWRRIHRTEGWGNDVLAEQSIHTRVAGRMWMLPNTSSWYGEWRGELTYKEVTGDFVVTTEVEPRNRAGTAAPGSLYSLAGIMVRTPRTMTAPAQWTPGGQNYVFLSMGAANQPGSYQYEVKTTINSQSTLYISNGAPARGLIQVARLGAHLIMLRREPGGPWRIHQRYLRPDMPATLQAGLTVYTDWPVCELIGYPRHNRAVLTNGARLPDGTVVSGCSPDLAASFEFVRYARPVVPAGLQGAAFSNPARVSDAQLLSFLGTSADVPGGAAGRPRLRSAISRADGSFVLEAEVETARTYRLQRSDSPGDWITLTTHITSDPILTLVDSQPPGAGAWYRLVSP